MTNIESFVSKCRIFTDATSLMDSAAQKIFLEDISKLNKNKIIIHNEVLVSLQEVIAQDSNKASQAKMALELIKEVEQQKKGERARGGKGKHLQDVLIFIFKEYGSKRKLCLITKDDGLAEKIMHLKDSNSAFQKNILILTIGKKGTLERYPNRKVTEKAINSKLLSEPFPKPGRLPFTRARIISNEENKRLEITIMPRTGSLIYLERENKGIRLGKEIASEKEGIIYETERENLVCKIFKNESRTSLKRSKLQLMTSRIFHERGICWPTSMVYNSYLEFVGFAMPKAKGVEIHKIIQQENSFTGNSLKWKRKDLIDISIDLMQKIKILHDEYNVFIGNISLGDILVTENRKTYLVDTDSYQVGNFPTSNRENINFLAPEILDENLDEILRTRNHERYTIAALLFMILMPGQTPYARQDEAFARHSIKNKEFPYPYKKDRGVRMPPGLPRYMWSHLHSLIREAFYQTFKNKTVKRLDAKDWVDLLGKYKWVIDNGSHSNEIFPTSFFEIDK
ncbi:MAG: hypothetical protein MI974_06385 [Chitinophagales bacterium]|nr:hypothetical protein [Chitinophagales bacterium]